jgi:group I intron endonuclease
MKCGVYCIRNTANGKVYVGQSAHIDARKQDHFKTLRGNYHRNKHLQTAFNKYGEPIFEFCILEETCPELLDNQERLWIAHFKSTQRNFGYNMEDGGNLNKHLSIETRNKIAEAQDNPDAKERLRKTHEAVKGRHQPQEERDKRSLISRTNPVCKEQWRKVQEGLKGRPLPSKHRKNLSIAHQNSPAAKEQLRKIQQTCKGVPLSLAHRKKLSESHKGKISRPKGFHHSIKARKKMSRSRNRYLARLRGEK